MESNRAFQLYNYKLYSCKHFWKFLKNAIPAAKKYAAKVGGVNYLSIFIDMVWCNLRFGASDSRDYAWFGFYNKSASCRNGYLTNRRYFRMIKSFDLNEFSSLIRKDDMYHKYSGFIKRDWICVNANTSPDVITEFIHRHHNVLFKPVSSEQGHGIKKVSENDADRIKELLEYREKGSFLLEELLVNCKELHEVCATSLNTIRIYTVVKNQEFSIMNMFLRAGAVGSVVDNWGSGGIGYNIDLETGIIDRAGIDNNGGKYIFHPGTNKKMVGLEIPHFKELCSFALEVARHNKSVTFAGLDIAILDNRLELIEVNFPGGRKGLQVMDDTGRYEMCKHLK